MSTGQKRVTNFLVKTENPAFLNETLRRLPNMEATVIEPPTGFTLQPGHAIVRVLGDPGWFEFAVTRQGYCKIVEQLKQ